MRTQERFRGLDDWEVLCSFLPEGWQDAARECGALQRARGVPDAGTLLRVLLVHLADGCSLQETALRVRQAGWCTLSPVAVFKRLQASEEWLRWMAERLWEHRARPKIHGGLAVRAVDATTIREPGSTGSLWRVHYAIDLGRLQCDYFSLTDVKGGETFRRIPVRSGDLMLGDRAYGTPPGIAHVIQRGGHVLTRINLRMLPLYTDQGRRISILSRLRTLRIEQVGHWPAWVQHGDGQPISGRLIGVKRSRQATHHVQSRMRQGANRRQRPLSEEALASAGYVFVWTSLPAAQMTARQILELYRLRWQIELAFKRAKSIMALGQLPKQADASARAWIHGKLMIALLLERILDEAESVSPWGYELVDTPEPVA